MESGRRLINFAKTRRLFYNPNAVFRIGNYWMQFLPREELLDSKTPVVSLQPDGTPIPVAQPERELSMMDDPEFATDPEGQVAEENEFNTYP